MALARRRALSGVKMDMSPMIDVIFQLLIYFLVSLEMEPSLDDRLVLADARYSVKQEDSELQIYVLKAALHADGTINPDSTGLIAFSDRAGNPDSCLYCGQSFKKAVEGSLVPDSAAFYTEPYTVHTADRVIHGGRPEIVDTLTGDIVLSDSLKADAEIKGQVLEGRNKFCRRCGNNVLFVPLDMIPEALRRKQEEILAKLVAVEDGKRRESGKPAMSAEDVESLKKSMPLMIKADSKTFYGRILQVVEKAQEAEITKFALVTSTESSWSSEHAQIQAAATLRHNAGSKGKSGG